MYSVIKNPYAASGNVLEFRGLSSDTKPVEQYGHGQKVGNGSTFFEMDTSKQYMYNEDAKTWVALTVVI